MVKSTESTSFASRLQSLLLEKGFNINKPTWLAKQFNARYSGEGISVQTAHNWLSGVSMPSQARLRVLAQWLEVSPEWLRYGDGDKLVLLQEEPPNYIDIMAKFSLLRADQKKAIQALIDVMLRDFK
jgi:hypothetical protein